MPFDNFDKKIKEAAEQHHPAYDENAWRKMESLLNQHLPQQHDRRRFFLLAFSVLLIGGGAFFFLSKPHAKNADQIVQQSKSSTSGNTQDNKVSNNEPLVQPRIDNTNTEIASDNKLPGETIKLADKGMKIPGSINRQNLVNSQSVQGADKNELV